MKRLISYCSLPLAVLAVSLTGCANNQPEHDAMMEKLEHHTRDIQQRWGVTSKLSSLKHGENSDTLDVDRLDDAMRRVVNFPGGYQGELTQLIEELATLAQYRYLAPAGQAPMQGIPVVFGDHYRTLGEYIYDAGWQAGARATVVLDLKSKTLQVLYTGY